MSAFTKGPWEAKVSKYDENEFIVQAGMPSMRVLAKFDGDGYKYDDTDVANARLISAAPDLLEALKVAQLWLDMDGRYDMQGINAAISKAEGNQP